MTTEREQVTEVQGLVEASPSAPVLLVSSCGGHFTELELIAARRGFAPDERHWVVPRTPQTETALEGAVVTWMPRVESRQLGQAVRNLRAALALHRRLRPRLVVSAGAAQAVPHLLAAAICRTPMEYDESVARIDGPSLTGRIAAHLPATDLVAPVEGWGGRWSHEPDLFSGFEVSSAAPRSVTSAVVSLGTEHFAFPRAVELVRAALPDAQITWQVGNTDAPAGDVELNRWLRPDVLAEQIASSSVAIVHGGAGSILTALRRGRVPVVLARSAERGEHVDDHQERMCATLAERGLIVLVRPGEAIERRHLEKAAALVVTSRWAPSAALPQAPRLAS
ncbi:MAG: hypothetical protein JWN91_3958 [Nocardioides sp.]|nr:hypothetical protein [Nocardioides sp.]